MKKILVFFLIFSIFSSAPSCAFLIKKDYKKKFVEDAISAEKRHNDKSAFHLFEKALFFYPKDEGVIKAYADFCVRGKYFEKAVKLYDKLYTLTKKEEYLYRKYLYQVKLPEWSAADFRSALQDKNISAVHRKSLIIDTINWFGDKKDWANTRSFCSMLKVEELSKDALANCILANEDNGNRKLITEYYLRYQNYDENNVEIVKKILELAEQNNNIALQEKSLKKFAALSPKDKGIRYRLAGFYIKTKQYYKASKIYEALIAEGDKSEYVKNSYAYALELLNPKKYGVSASGEAPGKPYVLTKEDKMYSYMRNKDFAHAQILADELLSKNPSNLKITRIRADIALEQKDYKSAIVYLEKLNTIRKDKSFLTYDDKKTLAFCYTKIEDYASALKIAEGLLSEKPNDKEVLELAIWYSMELKDYDKALLHVNKSLELDPSSEKLLKAKADLYSAKQDYPQAIQFYSELVKKFPKKEYLIRLANLYRAVNDNVSAQEIIEYVYNSTDKDSEIVELYLDILLSQGKSKEAYSVAASNNFLETKQGYRILGDMALLGKKYNKAECYYLKALDLDPDNKIVKLKLADSYRFQKKYIYAKQVYAHLLCKNQSDADAKMGLGFIELDREDYALARKIFSSVVYENPNKKDAKMGVVYSYMGHGDNIKSIQELRKLENDREVNFARAQSYYEMGMYSDAEDALQNNADPASDALRYKIKVRKAYILNSGYSFLKQQLSQNYRLNYDRVGVIQSKYIDNNINVFTEYNMYNYFSGFFAGNNASYTNLTNEVRGGFIGRPNENNAFRLDIGAKVFHDAGAMINTNSYIQHYFNDDFNLKLGVMRDNLIQSYLSAVGVPIDGVYTGQVADNKLYLDYEARHPKKFYSFGRAACGLMTAQNMLNNPYLEGMAGVGRILYRNPENKAINYVSSDIVSYNASYRYNVLNLFDSAGNEYGGYWSPHFFTADTINLRADGGIKKLNLQYGGKGFAGGQVSNNTSQANFIWGASAYLTYSLNDHLGVRTEYLYYNYADVQRHYFMVNLIVKGFRNGKT